MPQTHETPPLVGAGLLDNYSLAGNDIENTPAQFAAQAVCAALQRDFVAEALRVASIKAVHAADDVLLGDDAGAEREIRLAVSHLRVGSAAFRKMQGTIEGIADAIGAEAVL
jgi:hypothetical protein